MNQVVYLHIVVKLVMINAHKCYYQHVSTSFNFIASLQSTHLRISRVGNGLFLKLQSNEI